MEMGRGERAEEEEDDTRHLLLRAVSDVCLDISLQFFCDNYCS